MEADVGFSNGGIWDELGGVWAIFFDKFTSFRDVLIVLEFARLGLVGFNEVGGNRSCFSRVVRDRWFNLVVSGKRHQR